MQGQNNQEDNSAFYVLLSILFLAWLQNKIKIIGMQKIIKTVITIIASISFMLLLYLIAWKINRNRQNKKYQASLLQNRIVKQCETKEELPKLINQGKTKEELSEGIKQVTTKEELSKNAEIATRKEVTINVDSYVGLYKCSKLNLEEIKYLMAKGHRSFEAKSLLGKKKEKFLIKPRFNESLSHAFHIFDIAKFLERNGVNCQKYITKKPDIVFEIEDKKFAIEVETGKVLQKSKKQLMEKVKLLNENYDHWFFVATQRNYVRKYRKYGRTIDLRYLENKLIKTLKTDIEKRSKKHRPIVGNNIKI